MKIGSFNFICKDTEVENIVDILSKEGYDITQEDYDSDEKEYTITTYGNYKDLDYIIGLLQKLKQVNNPSV